MENPKVIMIASEDDALGAKYESNYPALGYKDITIVHPEELKEKFSGIDFIGATPEEDLVFVKHPFLKNRYIELQESTKIIEEDKMRSFGEICQFLGISEIQEEREINNSSIQERKAELEIAKGGVGATASFESSEDNKDLLKREVIMTFKNSGKTDYAKALAKAKEKNLTHDNDIMTVVEYCNPENLNTLESYKVTLSLSSEANKLTEIAGGLTLMKGILNISGKYESKFQEKSETRKTLYLKFN